MKIISTTIYRLYIYTATLTVLMLVTSCKQEYPTIEKLTNEKITNSVISSVKIDSPITEKLIQSGLLQIKYTRSYDPAYVKIKYPGGDVPIETGVCTDVVIRAFRKVGVDLQKEVHEDMKRNFQVYPKNWGLQKPDTNIDHRRVPNLMVYFQRHGKAISVTNNKEKFLPGDIVTWDLGFGQQHIGIVSYNLSTTTKNPLIIHNIGSGTKEEDILFNWKITGQYRYFN
jgi:uncharacterized protein